jgi:hypothetical protein
MRWFAARLSIAVFDTNAEYYQSLWEQEQMALKLQGLASKMAKFNHNIEADAEVVSAAIDDADAKRQSVMAKAKDKVTSTANQLVEVNTVLDELEQATNGGPALDDVSTPMPQVRGYPA